ARVPPPSLRGGQRWERFADLPGVPFRVDPSLIGVVAAVAVATAPLRVGAVPVMPVGDASRDGCACHRSIPRGPGALGRQSVPPRAAGIAFWRVFWRAPYSQHVWKANEQRKSPDVRGFPDGRYWARTSDPQLVELVLSQLS